MRVVRLNKFKVGQRVIGNEYNIYSVTKEGSVWYVTKIRESGYIIVANKRCCNREFLVNPIYFDLFMEEVE